jgi:16S rRNA (adenine1518-N6/adenine1519-N6)-dimethyltransferase
MRPNKFLGQNFLTSQKIIGDIIEAAEIKSDDVILEAGPGKGILTEELVKRAKKVIAVEKDERLVELLNEKFGGAKNLEIIHGDILKFHDSSFMNHESNYKIVANIPYYITSRFLKTFLQSDFQPYLMVLMVQKQVGERILARDGKESILSISVKAYGWPKIVKTVPAHYFSPKPKVDSVILKIDNISKDFFVDFTETRFFNLLKRGFSQKRKTLKNNLNLLNTECLTKCGIAEKARAEDLSPENWKCLVKLL